MAKIRTNNYKLLTADLLAQSIKDTDDRYYLFASRHVATSNSSVLETPEDTEEYKNNVYFNMIFGKRIQDADIVSLIPRHNWESNTIYTQYDDSDSDLDTKNYYAVVNAGAQYYVYKCLYNAANTPSTIEPDFSAVVDDSIHYETSDGYIWKYMYNVNSSIVEKFSTPTKFPIIANSTVSDNAVAGSIDVIEVTTTGNNYNNYLAGDNTFNLIDLRLGGNNLVYNIASNTYASASNGFYNGCYIYIKAGTPDEIGQFKKITSYNVNSTAKAIVLESAFTNAITMSAIYDIYPGVQIDGDGYQTSNATARAIVSPFGNTISKVEILDSGSGYKRARASVLSYEAVGANEAELRIIASPNGGHGFDAKNELSSTSLGVSVTFGNNSIDKILDSNDYRMIGILKNPEFSKVSVEHKVTHGVFLTEEIVYKIDPTLVAVNAAISTSGNTITCDLSNFVNQFSANDYIYLKTESDENNMLSKVVSVTNSSHLVLQTNAYFTSNAVQIYIPNIKGQGTVLSSNLTHVTLGSVDVDISTDDILVGYNSGTYSTANNTTISGEVKGFNSFINAYKYSGEVISGDFAEDITIYQVSLDTASALVHSTEISNGSIDIYATNQFGKFIPHRNIYSANTDSYCSTSEVFEPELVHRSGEILYMETINPVTRLPNQRETFKIILEF